MYSNSDIYSKNIVYSIYDNCYSQDIGGFMSRMIISKDKEKSVRNLLLSLALIKTEAKETVSVKTDSVLQLLGLVELLLAEKPVVIEDDLSSAEACEVAKVSKPMMLHYLKTGKVNGYLVGAHWRVKKDSLLKFIEDRESFTKMMSKMDEAGFGIDQDE